MTKPVVFLDPNWRLMDELFSPQTYAELMNTCEVIWGKDAKAPEDALDACIDRVTVWITTTPHVDRAFLDRAPSLRAVIEVSGEFPDTIDYAACAERGIDVLSCAPGFQQSVAEMTLAMILSSGRGLIGEHENFRKGRENWLSDNDETDFTLFGQDVGFVGFGSIAQATHRLLSPFEPVLRAYDPWLPQDVADRFGVTLCPLDEVAQSSRCLIIAATPTRENHQMINEAVLSRMPRHALLVVVSRAHLVDFDAVTRAVAEKRIRAAIDVFPQEPVPSDDPIRTLPGALLSPHRAAAIKGGRHLIGRMIVDDITAMMQKMPERRLAKADLTKIAALAGVGDAASVADMAQQR